MKRILLKVELHDDKHKRKAIKAVCTIDGIDQIAVDMLWQKMIVVGTVDPVEVVEKLRSEFFPTVQIVSVGPAKEEIKDGGPSSSRTRVDAVVPAA